MHKVLIVTLMILLSGASVQSAIIADSVADFSGTQGVNGWYYGNYETELTPSTFVPYPNYGDSIWPSSWCSYESGFGRGFLTAGEAYPGIMNGNKAAVRRWVSPYGGVIQITGTIQKEGGPATDWNNGVRARIYVGDNLIYDQYISGMDTTAYTFDLSPLVAVGSTVDLYLDGYGNNGCDRTVFTAQVVPEPVTIGLLTLGGLLLRRRK